MTWLQPPYQVGDFPTQNQYTCIPYTGTSTIVMDSDFNLKIKKVANGFILKDGSIEYVFTSIEELSKFLTTKFEGENK